MVRTRGVCTRAYITVLWSVNAHNEGTSCWLYICRFQRQIHLLAACHIAIYQNTFCSFTTKLSDRYARDLPPYFSCPNGNIWYRKYQKFHKNGRGFQWYSRLSLKNSDNSQRFSKIVTDCRFGFCFLLTLAYTWWIQTCVRENISATHWTLYYINNENLAWSFEKSFQQSNMWRSHAWEVGCTGVISSIRSMSGSHCTNDDALDVHGQNDAMEHKTRLGCSKFTDTHIDVPKPTDFLWSAD